MRKHEPKREPVPSTALWPAQSAYTTSNTVNVTWFRVTPCDCNICRVRVAGRRAVRKYGRALERLAH